uniref:Uncharacterized protein n=1 Tax=viral metagenome TaxID=1070528 RepID=A0A6M3L075_9ZZZZ
MKYDERTGKYVFEQDGIFAQVKEMNDLCNKTLELEGLSPLCAQWKAKEE